MGMRLKQLANNNSLSLGTIAHEQEVSNLEIMRVLKHEATLKYISTYYEKLYTSNATRSHDALWIISAPIQSLKSIVNSGKVCEATCYYYNDILDIYKLQNKSILVDECQFMKPKDVEYLVCYADECNIPLLGYGLKTDVNGNLFEGAKKWLALSDISIELENLCQVEGCTNKAILHKRFINGKPDKSTQSIVIDGVNNVTYLSVCRKHWRE